MAAGVVRFGDKCSGHDSCDPRPAIIASEDVFVNNKGVERMDDELEKHCDHPGFYQGNRDVYANNRPIQVQGDPIDCGSVCDECSDNVFAN